MDRKTLEAFLRLYEKKSLRAAAEELYISPQGLSRTIQALEAELDVMLFRRTNNNESFWGSSFNSVSIVQDFDIGAGNGT